MGIDSNSKAQDSAQNPGKVSEKKHETKGQPFRAGATDEGVIVNDNIGGASAGGIAGSGGVSTTDVGQSKTSKNPLSER